MSLLGVVVFFIIGDLFGPLKVAVFITGDPFEPFKKSQFLSQVTCLGLFKKSQFLSQVTCVDLKSCSFYHR